MSSANQSNPSTYSLSSSQGTVTISGLHPGTYNVTSGGAGAVACNCDEENDRLRDENVEVRTELILAKEKLDVAIKVIADLFESKPSLELAEQAKMRAELAQIVDDLLRRGADSERERKAKERERQITYTLDQHKWAWPDPVNSHANTNTNTTLSVADINELTKRVYTDPKYLYGAGT